jgi:DNA repair exonuclease SbcCD nuclease subunit
MIIADLPDVHLMERSPKNRKDKIGETCLRKLKWVLEEASHKSNCLAVPGDLFDSSLSSNAFIGKVGRLFLDCNIPIFAVPGQHDLRYHTRGLSNTPIGVLEAHKILKIPTIDCPIEFKGHVIYGCGWGDDEDLRELVDNFSVKNDILLIHRMITKDKALFEGQEDYIGAKAFLRRYPFKLVLSGDNHNRHITQTKNQTLINAGSMMRLTRGQIDYTPRLYFYDTDTSEISFTEIPCEPFEDVFDITKIEDDLKTEDRKQELDDFMRTINIDRSEIKFPLILHQVQEKIQPDKKVSDILDDIMEEAMK